MAGHEETRPCQSPLASIITLSLVRARPACARPPGSQRRAGRAGSLGIRHLQRIEAARGWTGADVGPHQLDRRASRRQADLVHRRRLGRRVEDHQRRHHLHAGLPERGLVFDRHRHDRSEEPEHDLGRHAAKPTTSAASATATASIAATMPGRTWRNLGLKDSQHIGRIVIDPRDSKVVFVAAYGPLWSAGGDRGLYKTTDGGANWTKILEHQRAHRHQRRRDGSDQSRRADRDRASAAASHVDADSRRARERHSQVDRRRRDLAPHPHRSAGRRSRPHRAGVLAGAEGPDLREGRDRREHRASTRRTTAGDSWERRGNVAGAADVLREHPSRSEERREAVRADACRRRSRRRRPHVPRRRRAQQARRQPLHLDRSRQHRSSARRLRRRAV